MQRTCGLHKSGSNRLNDIRIGLCMGPEGKKECYLFFRDGVGTKEKRCPRCDTYRWISTKGRADPDSDEWSDNTRVSESRDTKAKRKRRRQDRYVIRLNVFPMSFLCILYVYSCITPFPCN